MLPNRAVKWQNDFDIQWRGPGVSYQNSDTAGLIEMTSLTVSGRVRWTCESCRSCERVKV